jgi:hypothetical protein
VAMAAKTFQAEDADLKMYRSTTCKVNPTKNSSRIAIYYINVVLVFWTSRFEKEFQPRSSSN